MQNILPKIKGIRKLQSKEEAKREEDKEGEWKGRQGGVGTRLHNGNMSTNKIKIIMVVHCKISKTLET